MVFAFIPFLICLSSFGYLQMVMMEVEERDIVVLGGYCFVHTRIMD